MAHPHEFYNHHAYERSFSDLAASAAGLDRGESRFDNAQPFAMKLVSGVGRIKRQHTRALIGIAPRHSIIPI